jgi:hypothetical protein
LISRHYDGGNIFLLAHAAGVMPAMRTQSSKINQR